MGNVCITRITHTTRRQFFIAGKSPSKSKARLYVHIATCGWNANCKVAYSGISSCRLTAQLSRCLVQRGGSCGSGSGRAHCNAELFLDLNLRASVTRFSLLFALTFGRLPSSLFLVLLVARLVPFGVNPFRH